MTKNGGENAAKRMIMQTLLCIIPPKKDRKGCTKYEL